MRDSESLISPQRALLPSRGSSQMFEPSNGLEVQLVQEVSPVLDPTLHGALPPSLVYWMIYWCIVFCYTFPIYSEHADILFSTVTWAALEPSWMPGLCTVAVPTRGCPVWLQFSRWPLIFLAECYTFTASIFCTLISRSVLCQDNLTMALLITKFKYRYLRHFTTVSHLFTMFYLNR